MPKQFLGEQNWNPVSKCKSDFLDNERIVGISIIIISVSAVAGLQLRSLNHVKQHSLD